MRSQGLEESVPGVAKKKIIAGESLLYRVMYAREAGAVKRCHTQRFFGHYDVAQHTFNALCILRLLRPEAPTWAIWHLLGHDTPERLTGDIPATAKWFGITSFKLDDVEEQILAESGMGPVVIDPEWSAVIKGIDLLELYMWARDQIFMGNRFMNNMAIRIENWFRKNADNLPSDVLALYYATRNSEWFQCNELGD